MLNREDIIRMAREAGFLCDEDWITYGLSQFEHFAALVAAHEREECAKVCERRAKKYEYETDVYAFEHIAEAKYCAAAIRARGEK